MKTTISSKGQLVLPAELRKLDRIRAGQQFDVERVKPGEYLLRRLPDADKFGLMDWLLICPAKGWFVPLPGESTDEIEPL